MTMNGSAGDKILVNVSSNMMTGCQGIQYANNFQIQQNNELHQQHQQLHQQQVSNPNVTPVQMYRGVGVPTQLKYNSIVQGVPQGGQILIPNGIHSSNSNFQIGQIMNGSVVAFNNQIQNYPAVSSQNIPTVTSQNIPTASQNVPVVSSQNMPIVTSHNMPIASSHNVPIVSSQNIPIVTSHSMPIVSTQNIPIATSQNIPLVTSNYVPNQANILNTTTPGVNTPQEASIWTQPVKSNSNESVNEDLGLDDATREKIIKNALTKGKDSIELIKHNTDLVINVTPVKPEPGSPKKTTEKDEDLKKKKLAEGTPDSRGPVHCECCKKKFTRKSNLVRHMKQYHDYKPKSYKQHSKCIVESCNKVFPMIKKLVDHMEADHKLEVGLKSLTFESVSDFEKWKMEEEKTTCAFFRKETHTRINKQGGKRTYFVCNRSGTSGPHTKNYKPPKTNRRRHAGSCRIDGLCLSRMTVHESPEGVVGVKYLSKHSNHNPAYDGAKFLPKRVAGKEKKKKKFGGKSKAKQEETEGLINNKITIIKQYMEDPIIRANALDNIEQVLDQVILHCEDTIANPEFLPPLPKKKKYPMDKSKKIRRSHHPVQNNTNHVPQSASVEAQNQQQHKGLQDLLDVCNLTTQPNEAISQGFTPNIYPVRTIPHPQNMVAPNTSYVYEVITPAQPTTWTGPTHQATLG
ncbi:unnamed protein product [Owenia fusiformis]|uniref:Uncharacterized protein n=1 Tax=Owenia fusiformis TaxID=6347 RepID=A0A8J1XGR5_OWEFU|nr:unnamed protein product [Owenia fusiformis]